MPHILIEYTIGVQTHAAPEALLEAAFQGASKSALFKDEFIKTRATRFEHFRTGTTRNDYVHVTAKILSGRTDAQKQALTVLILDELRLLLGEVSPLTVTVEVLDIHAASHSQFLQCAGERDDLQVDFP